MKILIFGGGSVGLGIASCLIKSGEHVDIAAREDTVSAVKKHGLVRTGIFGDFTAGPGTFNIFSSLKAAGQTVYDLILVCTKSFDTAAAAKDIASCTSLLGEKTMIILCQNGWGNAEKFASCYPEEQIYSARIITGFYRSAKNHVVITVHADAIHIGSLFTDVMPEEIQHLCQAITKGGIPCEPAGSIEKDLWAKMLYNCALNPLGAIFNVPYGVLGENSHTRNIIKTIVEEIFHVMRKAGYTTHWSGAEDYLNVFYEKMLPPTAEHESSMLQDIRAEKRTEIDALNGEIVHLGETLKIKNPCNSLVCDMIKFLEAGYSAAH